MRKVYIRKDTTFLEVLLSQGNKHLERQHPSIELKCSLLILGRNHAKYSALHAQLEFA